ncbi:phosphotransferase KptA/Tpt1 [Linderina pennispora]|uniref:2'-phosphotransferase n=1 Tax=Linderina pennispora TaxID=61395 RepID=A0A1Y1VYS3_9FUNG|nr:phosphotransferase KptA/Tpt1 [Linderina pennispora]ORX66166.1 phosphotransferase KptA/Tpt1 [Linderina pennispora]
MSPAAPPLAPAPLAAAMAAAAATAAAPAPAQTPPVKLSKLLSYLLRHGAAKEGLSLRDDGSIQLSTLLEHPKLRSTTFDQIKHVVDTNDKKRYALFQDPATSTCIKIKQPPLTKLTPATLPANVIHGTTRAKYALIQQQGLSRMGRTHIHFATGLAGEQQVISGMRVSANTFIYVDAVRAMQDGIDFYLSENGVVLSAGEGDSGVIPPEYFSKVEFKD